MRDDEEFNAFGQKTTKGTVDSLHRSEMMAWSVTATAFIFLVIYFIWGWSPF